MQARVGTLKWGELTGGALRRRDRFALLADVLRARLARILARHGLARRARLVANVPPQDIRFPDSKAARDALDLCAVLSTEALLNHCLRTYVWGALLASCDRVSFDEELFFVASALHDLGLTARYRAAPGRCHCFALQGALAARQFALTRGWPAERSDRLAEAICLHLNIRVAAESGPEAALLHAGASVDVIGARLRELPANKVKAVLSRHPRAGFKSEIAATMKAEAEARPRSRAAFLDRLGLGALIRSAPFDE